MRIFFFCISLLATTSCYRMPEEGEVSVLPITNNPTITNPGKNNIMPGIGL